MPDVSSTTRSPTTSIHINRQSRTIQRIVPLKSTESPAPSLSNFDFSTFFRLFPLNSPVARYLNDLDMSVLMQNLQIAINPLSTVPYYCRAETLRKRGQVERELDLLDQAFAAVEKEGLNVKELRRDLALARGRLAKCIRDDEQWSKKESGGGRKRRVSESSYSSSSSSAEDPVVPHRTSRPLHIASVSDPYPIRSHYHHQIAPQAGDDSPHSTSSSHSSSSPPTASRSVPQPPPGYAYSTANGRRASAPPAPNFAFPGSYARYFPVGMHPGYQ